ncbi:unnamed protein product [Rotaria sp. Silwood2]|nr:unnamed protein product [Rotaria sp. Silwood2]CAF2608503.1 unnamed protein product [Rotaria sp. Silwood2]CAF2849802.1 unnamed protein product [Rotaria sp. Silwood2]CAF2906525.1 unnamed protein product [Rotaria sp. Silwood2]CAF4040526.1 unnamed protein product [Rotaria sp. Silwood2]
MFYLPGPLARIYLALNRSYQQSLTVLYRYVNAIIEETIQMDQSIIAQRKRTSLIASLVGSLQQDEMSEALKAEEDKRGLSRQEIFDEILLFLVAGFETTSTALTWFIYFVSIHPRVQTKMKLELVEHNIRNEEYPTVQQIDSLVYLDCVINEVLRFAPPINGAARKALADDRLPSNGTRVYKGEQIFIPFYNLARDKRYWTYDPDQFYPERYMMEGTENQQDKQYVSLAFGGGHRQCIGQDLARFELKVICTRLMQKVTFGDGGPEVNAGGYQQRLSIMPKHIGVTMTFDN